MIRDLGELGIYLQDIVSRLINNKGLIKLLYYTDKDPLNNPDLTDQQVLEKIYEKLIKVVPRVGPKETAQSIITLRVSNGTSNGQNDEFEDFSLVFDIFVPLTQWMIKDSNLRPFAIMSEIRKTLKGKKIKNFGTISGGDFQLNFLTEEISCYEMTFKVGGLYG